MNLIYSIFLCFFCIKFKSKIFENEHLLLIYISVIYKNLLYFFLSFKFCQNFCKLVSYKDESQSQPMNISSYEYSSLVP